MTRKDYELIASAINDAWIEMDTGAGLVTQAYREGIERAVVNLSNALKGDNSRFETFKFEMACFKE